MKIKITRAFTKKIQLKTFEPVEQFCAVEIEGEVESLAVASDMSKQANDFCVAEVEKSLAPVYAEVERIKNAKTNKLELKEKSFAPEDFVEA